jgi:mannose/cellobiose epimerase-like protein (N-acyl-D-glucosamine 2-epimerase family)
MNRRKFIGASALGGLAAASRATGSATPAMSFSPASTPFSIAGTMLADHVAELRRQLFEEYLPFWEKGAFDSANGGIMCYLNDDGSVADSRRDVWYQGRGVWVYGYLYEHLDANSQWLERAKGMRDFLVTHMLREDGSWWDTVDATGQPTEGADVYRAGNIYGALFAALGLVQYARVTENEADLALAKRSIRLAVERYEESDYAGVKPAGYTEPGLRSQGHSFMLVWVGAQLLELDNDPWFEALVRANLDLLAHKFWNPEYGISNESLRHDYSRIPGLEDHMFPGHSIETQWMASAAARQLGDPTLADIFRDRMRRFTEMSWDYVFDGLGSTSYRVHARDDEPQGAQFEIKSMWSHTELVIGALQAYIETGEDWALDWYNRSWDYIQRCMTTDHGVWRQAVDRQGANKFRPGMPTTRKGNFHQPRCLMMNLRRLEELASK